MASNPFKLIKYHLYLLQLENYELGRYWKLLIKRGWFPKQAQRKDLVWTNKARALLAFALGFHAAIVLALLAKAWLLSLVVFIGLFFAYPLTLSLGVILLWPLDFLVKQSLVFKARVKINGLPNLKIIGIAGSYGKTTMKEVLGEVLSAKFKVLRTPESVNTPVGVARWILKDVGADTQIIIVEMGEHYRGDVRQLCHLARPDISVVTGVNQAHLERMKTLDNVISTVFEIVSASQPKSLVLLNGDDELVMKHYKEFIWPDHKVEKFQISNFKFQKFNPEKLVWVAEFDSIGKVDINLLGEYALGDVDAAVKIGKILGMDKEQIRLGIAKLRPVEHRLQPVIGASNVLIIDDAYNGNPAGAAEAVKVLSRFIERRKIYITSGLVEMGKSAAEVHRAIGKQLSVVADIVILIKNSVTPYIEEGIRNYELGIGQDKSRIIWFDTAQEAHSSLGKILKPNDVVLFQNDWGDNYL